MLGDLPSVRPHGQLRELPTRIHQQGLGNGVPSRQARRPRLLIVPAAQDPLAPVRPSPPLPLGHVVGQRRRRGGEGEVRRRRPVPALRPQPGQQQQRQQHAAQRVDLQLLLPALGARREARLDDGRVEQDEVEAAPAPLDLLEGRREARHGAPPVHVENHTRHATLRRPGRRGGDGGGLALQVRLRRLRPGGAAARDDDLGRAQVDAVLGRREAQPRRAADDADGLAREGAGGREGQGAPAVVDVSDDPRQDLGEGRHARISGFRCFTN